MKRRVDVPRLLTRLGIEAKQRGNEWWAPCPFHVERTPSWQMHDEPNDAEHGLWRCFGCHVRGNAVQLVMSMLDIDEYTEARDWLTSVGLLGEAPVHMRVSIEVSEMSQHRFHLPLGVIFEPVSEWVTPAKRYLLSRAITPEQVDRWGIGYAIEGDLRGRIVFPIRDHTGKLLSYTGRTFVDARKRYKNPKSEEGADISAIWGEEHWPAPADRKQRTLVLSEGAINGLAIERVLALAFEGELPSVGALYGSQVQPGHIAKVATFGRVLVASDPDKAGDTMWDALRGPLTRWAKVARVEFAEQTDAAITSTDMLATSIGQAYDRARSTNHGIPHDPDGNPSRTGTESSGA